MHLVSRNPWDNGVLPLCCVGVLLNLRAVHIVQWNHSTDVHKRSLISNSLAQVSSGWRCFLSHSIYPVKVAAVPSKHNTTLLQRVLIVVMMSRRRSSSWMNLLHLTAVNVKIKTSLFHVVFLIFHYYYLLLTYVSPHSTIRIWWSWPWAPLSSWTPLCTFDALGWTNIMSTCLSASQLKECCTMKKCNLLLVSIFKS